MNPRELTKLTLENAKIQAFSHPLVAPPPTGFGGGVVLGDKSPEVDLRHTRYWRPVDKFSLDATYDNVIEKELIYAGPIYWHFGHFMSEMAHRFLPSRGHFGCSEWAFVGLNCDPKINSYDNLSSIC
jgi:hypothetical protein